MNLNSVMSDEVKVKFGLLSCITIFILKKWTNEPKKTIVLIRSFFLRFLHIFSLIVKTGRSKCLKQTM